MIKIARFFIESILFKTPIFIILIIKILNKYFNLVKIFIFFYLVILYCKVIEFWFNLKIPSMN